MLLWRLGNRSALVRQQAAQLLARTVILWIPVLDESNDGSNQSTSISAANAAQSVSAMLAASSVQQQQTQSDQLDMGNNDNNGLDSLALLLAENFASEPVPQVLAAMLQALTAIIRGKLNKINVQVNESTEKTQTKDATDSMPADPMERKQLLLQNLQPALNELLPKLLPILRIRLQEDVQDACISLVHLIAQEAAIASAGPREWLRIGFQLLDALGAPTIRKNTRRLAIAGIGAIAKAIGPADLMPALLNNLKVQHRTARISTTVAIAVVAETCGPFIVVPLLMNEYRVADANVQHGVLKSLAFLFEHLAFPLKTDASSSTGSGSIRRTAYLAKDYFWILLPLIEDALQERELVHRQLACSLIRSLALAYSASWSEPGMSSGWLHLLNLMWPNVLESSPHMVLAFFECLEALRLVVPVGALLGLVWQGLFHPARRLRERYWRVYNQLVIACGHSMIPCYPVIHHRGYLVMADGKEKEQSGNDLDQRVLSLDDDDGKYRRWEQELVL